MAYKRNSIEVPELEILLAGKKKKYVRYADAFNAAFKEYSASILSKAKKPSVLEKLHELAQAAAELPGKVRNKEQERGL